MRALRTCVIGLLAMLALSACEMTVRFTTTLEGDGAGRFAVGVLLDRDAREQIDLFAERFGRRGFASLEGLFEGLETEGWVVERTEPDGGLALEASTPFSDPADFSRVLGELRSAREAEDPGLTQGAFSLDVGVERSFLRSKSTFSGQIDTSIPDPTDEQRALIDFIRQVLRLEVRTELPSVASNVRGPASADGGVVVWTPAYGTTLVFGAEASSIRLGSLLLVLVPVLILLGIVGAMMIARRSRRTAPVQSAIEWEPLKIKGVPVEIDDVAERTVNGHARAQSDSEPPAF